MITQRNITDNDGLTSIHYRQLTEDGREMSHAYIGTRMTRYLDKWVPAMTVGGVGTAPQYRRGGCVRKMLEDVLPRAREYGWYFSMMHPFSFSYYRQFGYERISDKVIADMPMTALDFVPRYPDLVPLGEAENPEDIIRVFDAFSVNRNLTFSRASVGNFQKEHCETYLDYNENGICEGYVTVEVDNYYDGINRMVSVNLIVHEIVYLNKAALLRLLGFLRMYEGELKTVHFRDIGMTPEVDLCFKHFMDTRYDIRPDIGVRILDTAAMLCANVYPASRGVFTLRVEDTLDSVRGTYRVEYEGGTCAVETLSDTAMADLTVTPTALAKFLFGTHAFSADNAAYLDGVKLDGDASDFFRAFPKRVNGLYEHF